MANLLPLSSYVRFPQMVRFDLSITFISPSVQLYSGLGLRIPGISFSDSKSRLWLCGRDTQIKIRPIGIIITVIIHCSDELVYSTTEGQANGSSDIDGPARSMRLPMWALPSRDGSNARHSSAIALLC
jgi:hypothetical protein